MGDSFDDMESYSGLIPDSDEEFETDLDELDYDELLVLAEDLKSKLEKAKEALKFYAEKSNWYPNERWKELGRIDDNDLEYFFGNQTSDLIGGKMARKALEGLE